MDSTFAAEKKVTRLMDLVLAVPPGTSELSKEVLEAKAEAIEANLAILSGDRGRKLVRGLCNLVRSFECEEWNELNLTRSDRFTTCLRLLIAIPDAEARLVWYYQQGKFELFEICRDDEFHENRVEFRANRNGLR